MLSTRVDGTLEPIGYPSLEGVGCMSQHGINRVMNALLGCAVLGLFVYDVVTGWGW